MLSKLKGWFINHPEYPYVRFNLPTFLLGVSFGGMFLYLACDSLWIALSNMDGWMTTIGFLLLSLALLFVGCSVIYNLSYYRLIPPNERVADCWVAMKRLKKKNPERWERAIEELKAEWDAVYAERVAEWRKKNNLPEDDHE